MRFIIIRSGPGLILLLAAGIDTYTHAKNILFLLPMFISKVDILKRTLKVIQAIPSMPKPVTETEVNNFLKANSTYRLPLLTKKDIL